MLMNTPLASTMPSSGPSLKLKNTSASNPTTVVSELEAMEETEPASAVFMAETLIIGLLSGLIGVGLTYILNIFITRIMVNMSGFENIAARLPAGAALVLVLISITLSLLAGLIPSRIAAKKDPVEALSAE